MDFDKTKQKIDLLLTDEQIDDLIEQVVKDENHLDRQVERLRDRNNNFSTILQKTIVKYGSKKYRDGWYNRGIEPPENLFWIFYRYAEKYGRKCTEDEWEKYANMFTYEMFFVHGYYISEIRGQGSFIKIVKDGDTAG